MISISEKQASQVNGGWIVKAVKSIVKYVAKSNVKKTTASITASGAGAGAGVGSYNNSKDK